MKKPGLNAARQRRFLAALAETGNVSHATLLIGTSRSRIYALRHNDPDFARAWDEAEETACGRLEEEARRRAVEGFDEPLVSAGKLVCDEDGNPVMLRRYSDTLLLALLKAHRPQKFDRRAPATNNVLIAGNAGRDIRAMLLAKLAQTGHQADPGPEPEPDLVLLDHASEPPTEEPA